jgi:hypothetical protein
MSAVLGTPELDQDDDRADQAACYDEYLTSRHEPAEATAVPRNGAEPEVASQALSCSWSGASTVDWSLLHGAVTPELKAEARRRLDASRADSERDGLLRNLRDKEREWKTTFPYRQLPEPLQEWTDEGHRALKCPHDLVGVPLLAFAATAIGAKVCIEMEPGHQEPATVFCAVVARPGSKKSPASKHAKEPLRAAFNDQRQGANPEDREPSPLVTSSTVEGLHAGLSRRPDGLCYAPDELDRWFSGLGEYKSQSGSDRAFFCEAWTGEGANVLRKTAESYELARIHLCITGTIQPDVLRKLKGPHDGLLDRFLWTLPDAPLMLPSHTGVNSQTRQYVTNIFARLLTAGGTPDAPLIARMDQPATLLYRERIEDNLLLRDKERESDAIVSIIGKLDSYLARLALIDHVVRAVDDDSKVELGTVTVQSIEASWALTTYFLAQARKVHGVIHASDQHRLRERLLQWMGRHNYGVQARDLVSAGVVPTVKEADVLFRELSDLELIHGRTPPGKRKLVYYPGPSPDHATEGTTH